MIRKVKEMIKLIELDGWYLCAQQGILNSISMLLKKEE